MTNSHVANYISRGKNEAPDENRTERASKLVTLLRPGQLSAVAVVRDCYETVYSLLSQTASWIIPSVFSYTLNIYPRMWKNRNSPSGELPLYRNRRRRHTATCLCVRVCVCVCMSVVQFAYSEKRNSSREKSRTKQVSLGFFLRRASLSVGLKCARRWETKSIKNERNAGDGIATKLSNYPWSFNNEKLN